MSTHLVEQLQRAAQVKAFESPEAALVAKVNRLKAEANMRSWELADSYAELHRLGWTQERIADLAGSSQQSVSRFMICVKNYPLVGKRPPFWEAFQEAKGGKKEESPPVAQPVTEAPEPELTQVDEDMVVGKDGTEFKAVRPKKPRTTKPRTAPGDDHEAEGEPGASPHAQFADRMEKCICNRLDEMLQTLIIKEKDIENLKAKFKFDFNVLRGHASAKEQPAPEPIKKQCMDCGRDIVLARTVKNSWMSVQETSKGGRFDIIEKRIVAVDNGPYRAHYPMCSGKKK